MVELPWPTDPFSALSEKPAGHTNDGDLADTDGEWTFIDNMDGTGQITHQRADNSRYTWDYNSGTQEDDDADTAQIGLSDQELKSAKNNF